MWNDLGDPVVKWRNILEQQFNEKKTQYAAFIQKMSYKWRFSFSREERQQICDIALWKSIRDYSPEKSKFITFLGQKIKWEFLDTWNAEKETQKTVTLSVIMNPQNYKKECVPESMSVIDRRDLDDQDLIEAVAKRLTSKRKEIFMSLLSGKNITQISKELDLTHQRVRQLILHIKKTAAIIKIEGGF